MLCIPQHELRVVIPPSINTNYSEVKKTMKCKKLPWSDLDGMERHYEMKAGQRRIERIEGIKEESGREKIDFTS